MDNYKPKEMDQNTDGYEPDELDISPEMIDAGLAVLYRSGVVDGQVEADMLVVAEVFRAMIQHRPPKFRRLCS